MKLYYYAVPGRIFWTKGMLYYHDVEFEHVVIKDGNEWGELQATMNSSGKFIKADNPYLIDGDVHLVESLAIAKYVTLA